ncbi:hypothetical protein scyTo_0005358 [Scyliorhinus torazame]|uniref:AJAP1/PANP C-terminal domain-containing protein n=1 Tax=Scyliorhinus torazame TaxID=75743 RepID=A0A401P6M7_SCYTO|nr:hypothetical protein [Scyliorhinus torazame]
MAAPAYLSAVAYLELEMFYVCLLLKWKPRQCGDEQTCLFYSCAENGNGHRNSHQRKINQQEESCQNLTDFTAARVPSNLDIFTAYNETLQCSHECVRASMPVYADQGLHQTTVYKTTFNGNRIPLVNL